MEIKLQTFILMVDSYILWSIFLCKSTYNVPGKEQFWFLLTVPWRPGDGDGEKNIYLVFSAEMTDIRRNRNTNWAIIAFFEIAVKSSSTCYFERFMYGTNVFYTHGMEVCQCFPLMFA